MRVVPPQVVTNRGRYKSILRAIFTCTPHYLIFLFTHSLTHSRTGASVPLVAILVYFYSKGNLVVVVLHSKKRRKWGVDQPHRDESFTHVVCTSADIAGANCALHLTRETATLTCTAVIL